METDAKKRRGSSRTLCGKLGQPACVLKNDGHGDTMTKVVESKDCGNSPKNLFVQTLAVSIERGDCAAFQHCVVEEILGPIQVARLSSEASLPLTYFILLEAKRR